MSLNCYKGAACAVRVSVVRRVCRNCIGWTSCLPAVCTKLEMMLCSFMPRADLIPKHILRKITRYLSRLLCMIVCRWDAGMAEKSEKKFLFRSSQIFSIHRKNGRTVTANLQMLKNHIQLKSLKLNSIPHCTTPTFVVNEIIVRQCSPPSHNISILP
jgi:hypothetical protein